ncbi:hypothetical protein D3C81_2239270 [compost metagenome]
MPEHLGVPEVYQIILGEHWITIILLPGLAFIAAVSQTLTLPRLACLRMGIGMRKDRHESSLGISE